MILADKILDFFQRRCTHPGDAVRADILEGSGRENVEVQWCLRCGAYRTAYPKLSPPGSLRVSEWRRPRPTWVEGGAPAAPPMADAKEEKMALKPLDGKFGITPEGRIANLVSEELIPEDEPLFVLRGRDYLAEPTICYYMEQCARECNGLHLDGIRQSLGKFRNFSMEHRDRMKQPGITKHLKLEAPAQATREQLVAALKEMVDSITEAESVLPTPTSVHGLRVRNAKTSAESLLGGK